MLSSHTKKSKINAIYCATKAQVVDTLLKRGYNTSLHLVDRSLAQKLSKNDRNLLIVITKRRRVFFFFWHTWRFSDEVPIDRTDGDYTKWSFYSAGERLDRDKVQPQRPPRLQSRMFFAAISLQGTTNLIPLDGDPRSKNNGIAGRILKACLEERLPSTVLEGMTCQHDNGPTFKAHITQDWLKKWARHEGVISCDFPPYSPDLNPIENIWKILKKGYAINIPRWLHIRFLMSIWTS
ncbi:hypothetical protein FOXG_22726 [Fusarium oxysporum f. sp. lycopersici 4287]|uniref:Tc1-like transposase DDE domain-containing protein n=1 Tax=Fusarium oxysporum f. sp. lycopersici (strain 4287 / CBS 123668 / FGSC 9935 / NRRL 34936) TaxID=426428 RepID=A0A0J9WAX5_FUSO4|nr:hypothetical protein FOXG_22726 [Fusarium oxysporum f. sp. lycopersici 4287]EWZ77553.1 hypothetical protein FOWG_18050 [Fusarium oxysporum f. sp. lycopersici MN25]KNB20033.1 hypothetical protein FOXG_22726 [Fusarium oxysporum f. sp. lycopersici 4287]